MTAFLGIVTGALGKHWKLIGIGVLLLAVAVQSGRLSNAKNDLAGVRSDLFDAREAQIDPDTKRSWRVEAIERERDLGTCRANATALTGAIDRQSAATEAAAAQGRIRTAEAEKAVQAARTAMQRAEAAGRAILNHQPTGGDTCARVLDVDELFVKELR
jgi:hypothetical protein